MAAFGNPGMYHRSIRLKVDGESYSTTLGTLTKAEGSYLKELFDNRDPPLEKNCDRGYQEYILNFGGDGGLFIYVLNFLGRGKMGLPVKFRKYDGLMTLAKKCRIGAMVTELESQKETLLAHTEIVDLNVGGVHYTTTKETLCTYEGSALWKIFNPTGKILPLEDHIERNKSQWESEGYTYREPRYGRDRRYVADEIPVLRDNDGRYVIDRNGQYFGYILDILRDGTFDNDVPNGAKLIREAKFYGLYELSAMLVQRESHLPMPSRPQRVLVDNLHEMRRSPSQSAECNCSCCRRNTLCDCRCCED